jgi:hypothetical protein
MRSRRFIILLVIAGLGLTAIVVVAQDGAGDAVAPAPPPIAGASPDASAPAEVPASPGAAPSASAAAAPASGNDTLEAVRTLKRFCDLVDDGRRRAAGRLLAGPWVWPRRELVPIARLRLLSARPQEARSAGHVVLLARVRALLRGPSPLHDGVNTLFFTLGRDGTTGGWLVTAVTTSP